MAASPSGTGFQFSLGGVLGAAAALHEGLELNLGGLVLGIDTAALGIKLPGIGTLGLLAPAYGQAMTGCTATADE